MKWISFFLVLISLFGGRLVFAAQSSMGKWKTVDEKSAKATSEVEIYERSGFKDT